MMYVLMRVALSVPRVMLLLTAFAVHVKMFSVKGVIPVMIRLALSPTKHTSSIKVAPSDVLILTLKSRRSAITEER